MHRRYLPCGLHLMLLAAALHTNVGVADSSSCQRSGSGTGIVINTPPAPPEGFTAYSGDTLKVTVQMDQGVQLSSARVEANGMSVREYSGQELRPDVNGEIALEPRFIVGTDESGSIRLQPGLNQLRIEVWDSHVPSRCTFKDEIGIKALNPETYAVLIGINNYSAINKPLKHAMRDADEMAVHLMRHNGVPKRNITLLTDEWQGPGADPFAGRRQAATWSSIQVALIELADMVDRRGTVILYYSGHGFAPTPHARGFLESYYLMASDSSLQPAQADATLLRFTTIEKRLDRIAAKNKLVILDTCFSSAVVTSQADSSTNWRSKVLGPAANISGAAAALMTGGDDVYLMSSSRDDQESYEFDDLRHGIFTYYLLRGTEKPEAMFTDASIHGAFKYAKDAVEKAVPQRIRGKVQVPNQWLSGSIDEMIWRRRNTSKVSGAP